MKFQPDSGSLVFKTWLKIFGLFLKNTRMLHDDLRAKAIIKSSGSMDGAVDFEVQRFLLQLPQPFWWMSFFFV